MNKPTSSHQTLISKVTVKPADSPLIRGGVHTTMRTHVSTSTTPEIQTTTSSSAIIVQSNSHNAIRTANESLSGTLPKAIVRTSSAADK